MLRDGWDQSEGGRRTRMRASGQRGLWIDLSCVVAEASLKSEFVVLHHYYEFMICLDI